MPEFGEVAFTLTNIVVAALDVEDDTYGTPVALEYGQKLEFAPVADNDMIKAYGMIAELLSVVTHATGTLSQGSIDMAGYGVLIGGTATESGSGSSSIATLDHQVGGSGLPYFGLIGKLASVNGADLLVGFYKAMLDTIPGFTIEQNKFVLPEASMKMITPDVATRKLVRLRTRKTAAAIPTSQADFQAFFA